MKGRHSLVGESDKAACRKEVFGVREEEEGVKETVTFQLCLGSWYYSFVALVMLSCLIGGFRGTSEVCKLFHIFQSILTSCTVSSRGVAYSEEKQNEEKEEPS